MQILAIGDPHFKVNNVKETDEMCREILRFDFKDIAFVVVLGDILDRHESIHVSPLVRATKFLQELSKVVKVYCLIGNHDLKNNRQFFSDEHPFTALKNWTNIIIVDRTITVDEFVFVPYVPPGRFLEALKDVDLSKIRCIFAHQEFKGCKMGAIISQEGDEWPSSYPMVISGHIHDYQRLSNILYTGTPIQHTYGESEKSISLIKIDNDIKFERIYLNVKKKYIIRVKFNELDCVLPDGDFKIIISGTTAELKAAMVHPNIEIWKKLGYKIAYKDIPVNVIPEKREVINYSTALYNKLPENLKLLFREICA